MTRPRDQKPLGKFTGTWCCSAPARWARPCSTAGWRAGSIRKQLIVLEPQPGKAMKALARRGLALNPEGQSRRGRRHRHRGQAADRAGGGAAARAAMSASDRWSLRSWPGARLRFLEQALPAGTAIVRAMPNTPAAIGRGITVAVPNAQGLRAPAQARHRSARRHRRGRMGRGRGADGRGHRGVRLRPGLCLPAGRGDDARPASPPACRPSSPRRLARETVAGSGELLHRSPLDAATLRQNVTSPGGTTAAALDVLMGRTASTPC